MKSEGKRCLADARVILDANRGFLNPIMTDTTTDNKLSSGIVGLSGCAVSLSLSSSQKTPSCDILTQIAQYDNKGNAAIQSWGERSNSDKETGAGIGQGKSRTGITPGRCAFSKTQWRNLKKRVKRTKASADALRLSDEG